MKISIGDSKRVRIDVGLGRSAPFTNFWVRTYPDVFVLGFQPSKLALAALFGRDPNQIFNRNSTLYPQFESDSFDNLLKNEHIILPEINTIIFPYALTSTQWKNINFYETTDSSKSSVYKPLAYSLKSTTQVIATTLDSILDCVNFGSVEFIEVLNIDSQGHDLDILMGARKYLEKIMYVQVVIPINGQYEMASDNFIVIDSLLRSHNFYMEQRDPRGVAVYSNFKYQRLQSSIPNDYLEVMKFNDCLFNSRT